MIEQKSIIRFWNKVVKKEGCWEFKSCKDRDGYQRFAYKTVDSNKFKHSSAHRFMMLVQGHTIPPGHVIMHECDNPSCVNPAHLRIGTVQDNNLDKLLKGRAVAPKGERQAHASLTDEQARQIKSRAVVGTRVGKNNGSNLKELAKEFNCKTELVRRIARGELYKHV
jgi:hypothetical protein